MKNQTLEQQIDNLKMSYSIKEDAAAKLQGIKHLSRYDDFYKKSYVWGDANTKEDFQQFLSAYPVTGESHTVSIDKIKIDSPFKVDIKNPATPSQYNPFLLHISYTSENTEIGIDMPIEMFSSFVETHYRKVSDSERHYFVGMSDRNFAQHRVKCYVFKSSQINFYGGQKTLKDTEEITAIINYLTEV